MPANFTIPLITVIPGQTITAALWNNEFENIDDNFIPSGMDDYSANDSEMQTATDPYPAAATSRPTSLQGEIERLRYQLAAILGETYWYIDPDTSIADLTSRVVVLEGALTAPSGTKAIFYQASAPTGWTAEAVNDMFLRVVTAGGTGGTTGGTGLTPSSTITLAHTHTVAAHTHTGPSHTHTFTSGSDGSHSHTLNVAGGAANATFGSNSSVTNAHTFTTDSQGSHTHTGTTDAGGTGSTGSSSPATDSQLSNTAFQYADVIIAAKD